MYAKLNPDKYQQIASSILGYYMRTRAVGHTFAAINGVQAGKSPCLLVVCDYSHAESLAAAKQMDKKRMVVMDDFANGKMSGLRNPIVFDNLTLIDLLSGLLGEIEYLKKQSPDPSAK